MNSEDTPTTPLPDQIVPPEPSPVAPAAVEEPRRSGIRRPLLIGAAAGVGVLLIGGLGAGAIAALNDRESFDTVPAAEVAPVDTSSDAASPAASAPAASATADDSGQGQQSTSATQPVGGAPGDPVILVAVIDLAVAAAEGTGASSVEVESHGWSVDVILADGSEVDVRVASDGTTTVRADHRDDKADPPIDTGRIADITAAAIAAAGSGAVTSIETDDGGYEVSVALSGGPEAGVSLAADLTVIEVDRD